MIKTAQKLALGFLLALTSSSIAQAQNDEAERAIRRGVELRQGGDVEAALAEFRRAHAIIATPRSLAQIALAEQALGRWVDADRDLRAALRFSDNPWIVRNRPPLDGALRVIDQHVGSLIIDCESVGAELSANGVFVGVAPLHEPVRVEVGSTNVVAVLGARHTAQRIQVTAGQTTRVSLHLREQSAPSTLRTADAERRAVRLSDDAATTRTHGAEPDASAVAGREATSTSVPSSTQRRWGIGTLVLSGLGLTAGIAGTAIRENEIRVFYRCRSLSVTRVSEGCLNYLDNADAAQALQFVGFISAGAFAITGIILLATAPTRTASRSAALCGPGPGDLGLSCGVQF